MIDVNPLSLKVRIVAKRSENSYANKVRLLYNSFRKKKAIIYLIKDLSKSTSIFQNFYGDITQIK